MRKDQVLKLKDGRSLGWARFGSAEGSPLFYFHGWPGSRVEAEVLDAVADGLGIQIIAADRPGYGLSDFQPDRTILDWPRDVQELADSVGLETFSVVGVSGGGPYAAACAHAIPDRLENVGIVCGLGPSDASSATREMMPLNRFLYLLARRLPEVGGWVFDRLAGFLQRDPSLIVSPRMIAGLPAVDRETLRNPVARGALTSSMAEAFRQGTSGARQDGLLYARPWGFALEGIETEIQLWHGELDVNVPVSMGRDVARRLPHCRARFLAEEGHMSLPFNHATEILKVLSGIEVGDAP